MDKVAMDALNRGWALGFATQVRMFDADLEAAQVRTKRTDRKRSQAVHIDISLLVAVLARTRAAH